MFFFRTSRNFRLQLLGIIFSVCVILLSIGQINSSSQEIKDVGLIKTGEDFIVFSQIPHWEDLIPNREMREVFISNTEFGIAIVDLDGGFIRVNRALCRILGYSEQELLSMSFVDVTHSQDKVFDIASANTLISDPSRRSYLMLKKYVRKTDEVVNCLLEVFIETDEDGNPAFFVSKVVPMDSHIVRTNNGSKLVANSEEKNFSEFFNKNLPWIVTSFLAALSFSILIGRNLQKQIEFNKKVKNKLNIDED